VYSFEIFRSSTAPYFCSRHKTRSYQQNFAASALSTLSLRVDLSRFSRLAKHGDRRKPRHVTEIERKARREKIDEDIHKLRSDRALDCRFLEGFEVLECLSCSHANCQKRIRSNDHWKSCLFNQSLIQSLDQSSTTGKDHSSLNKVSS